MIINIKAVYADGVFKPLEPSPLRENQIVSLNVTPFGTAPQLQPNDFASLYGIWRNVPVDLDAALRSARVKSNAKLRRIIRSMNQAHRKRANARRNHILR